MRTAFTIVATFIAGATAFQSSSSPALLLNRPLLARRPVELRMTSLPQKSAADDELDAAADDNMAVPQQQQQQQQRRLPLLRPGARRIAKAAAVSSAVLLATATAASATAVGAEEHLHLGQKVAQFFRGFGLADEAVITIISAMPVVELRGAIPVGIWMGLPMAKVFALCVLGNMIPIAPLLYALRFGPVQKVMKPILTRAQSKAEAAFADPKSRAVLLAAFVGIPLPGTGAWTGAMGAFLLGMPFAQAFTAIFAGVLCSGCIMTAISRGGKFGIAVGVLLLGSMLTQVSGSGKKAEEPPAAAE